MAEVPGSAINDLTRFSTFLIFCIITVVIVVLYLFFFNRLVAFLLSYFLRLYTWRKHKAYVRIESIQFGILAGRILFKNFQYVGENMSLSILQGHITFRYWLRTVRGHTATTDIDPAINQHDDNLPCRIMCTIEGLEVFLYNNTKAYKQAKRQLNPEDDGQNESQFERTATNSSRAMDIEKIKKYLDSSIFLKLLPIQFDCRVGAVIIGNTRLESLLTIEFMSGNGVYTAAKAKSLLDYYQSQLIIQLARVRVSLREHADYGHIDKAWHNYTNLSQQRCGWFKRWFLCHSSNASDGSTSEYEVEHTVKLDDKLPINRESQYAAVADILECNQLDMVYYSDVVGTVPPIDQHLSIENDKIGNGDIAPEWGLQLKMRDNLIQYGPWADNQRGQLQDFFYPATYRNQPATTFLQHGDARIHTAFNLNIQFLGNTNFRIPTREPSKDWLHVPDPHQLSGNHTRCTTTRPYGWLDIQVGANSTLLVVVPSIIDDIGYTTKVELFMHNVDLTTSVDYASLLLAPECRFVGYMDSPRIWNAKRLWTYSIAITEPEIFLLRDHITLIQDLINDWTAGPAPDMAHFIPMAYEYHVSLTDLKLRMCVNEHNVINQTNDFDENAFITLSTPILAVEFKSQFYEYMPREVSLPFQIKVAEAGLSMNLPALDTNGAFLTEEARHFLSVGILEIGGSYDYYPQLDMNHVDCLTLRLKADDVTGRLFGFIIRYIIILTDNYFGDYVDFTTTDDYRNGDNDTMARRTHVRRRQAAKPISNPFEVHVIAIVTRGFLFLPETLYDIGERPLLLEFDELQVENRNVDFYQDLLVSSSPIKLSRGSPALSGRRTQTSAARSMWERTESIYLDDLNIHAHRLFGPMPNTLTYVCHWEIDAGRLSGRVRPAFLESVISAIQRLDYQMDDFENALPRHLSPPAYPDVTFLRVGLKQLDLTIWGSQETATRLLLPDGIRLEFQNLIGEKYSKKTRLTVPQIVIRSLAATKSDTDDPIISSSDLLVWTEVAFIETSLDFTAYSHTSDWYEKRELQRNFLHDQDRNTRRCTFLYSSDTDTIREEFDEDRGRPSHRGALYIPPFQPSFADEESMMMALHRHSLQSYSTGQHSTGSKSFPVEEIDDSDNDDDHDNVDLIESEHEYNTNNHEYGRSLHRNLSQSRYSISNRSRLSRRSSAVESFRTAWDSHHSRSTYEGRDNSPSIMIDINAAIDADDADGDEDGEVLYSPDEDMVMGTPSKPLSIPYHKYLRRFQMERQWQPSGNGHLYIAPMLTTFVPETNQEETITNESWRPPFYDMWRTFIADHYDDNTIIYYEDGERRSAFVIDIERSVDLLVTPVFLRIVADLLESLDNEDRSPEKLLDSLHMSYMSRFFTAQNTATISSMMCAVAIPCIHIHAIQDVALPADLTSYDGYSNHRTLYDLSGTLLCAGEIIVDALCLRISQQTHSVTDELPQLKVNLTIDSLRTNLRFVSSSDFTGITGIPGVMCSIEPSPKQGDRNEPVVVSCSADDITIQLTGGGILEDRLSFNLHSVSATCVHQAIEIVAGAAVAWLSFVDQLERILNPFTARWSARDRLLIAALAESSDKEVMPGGDAAFLTRPSIAWRLSPPPFQGDSGWWLLTRLRHCAHSLSSIQINRVKQRVRLLDLHDKTRVEDLYEATRRYLSSWIYWDQERDRQCRLLDQVFGLTAANVKQHSSVSQDGFGLNTLLNRLAREQAGAVFGLTRIHLCIYEPKSENNITLGPVKMNIETKRRDKPSGNGNHYTKWTPDARVSIMGRFFISQIDIDISPSMLSLVKHVLEVQRSFSSYQPLNHFINERDSAAQTPGNKSASHRHRLSRSATVKSSMTNNPDILKWIDYLRQQITIQMFVSLQSLTITASAHNLLLRSQLSALHLSLLSCPHSMTMTSYPALSDTSSNGAMAVMMSISLMLRRFTVTIQELARPSSQLLRNNNGKLSASASASTATATSPIVLLEIELTRQRINGSTILFDPSQPIDALPDLLSILGSIGGISIRIPQSLLKLYYFVEEWKTDNLPTYDFLLHRIHNEWKQTRRSATPSSLPELNTPHVNDDRWTSLVAHLRIHLLVNTLRLQADTLPSLSGCYTAQQLMLAMQPGHHRTIDIQGQIHDQQVRFSTRPSSSSSSSSNSMTSPRPVSSTSTSTSSTSSASKSMGDKSGQGVFPIPAIRFGSRYRSSSMMTSAAAAATTTSTNANIRRDGTITIGKIRTRSPPVTAPSSPTLPNTTMLPVSSDVLDVVVTVDFVDLVLDADLMDKVITIQGLLGNEINDALEVFMAAKKRYQKPSPSSASTSKLAGHDSKENQRNIATNTTSSNSSSSLHYSVSVALLSARVTAMSPAAAMVFESDVLRGYLSNHISDRPLSSVVNTEIYWRVVAKGLTLSLCHGSVVVAGNGSRDTQWRHRRLAFILLDFKLQNFRERSPDHYRNHTAALLDDNNVNRIYIQLDRAHAVMQPVALGKLVDFVIYYNRELSRRREAKAAEIKRLTDNTRRVLRSLDVELPKYKETGRSLLEDKSISIQVSRLTVAMPLVRDWEGGVLPATDHASSSSSNTASSSVPAFLISATAIDILTRRWEASCGLLNQFYIQFVPRFNQAIEDHFDPAWHPRVNRILLPALQCEAHAVGTRQMKQVWFDAWASGLEVDIDSHVVHHIGTLSAIWAYSRERFEVLTAEALASNDTDDGLPTTEASTSSSTDNSNNNNRSGESIQLAIEARLMVDSGICRFHPRLPRLLRHTPHSETNQHAQYGKHNNSGSNNHGHYSSSTNAASKRLSTRFSNGNNYATRLAQLSQNNPTPSTTSSTDTTARRNNYDNILVVPGLSLRSSVQLPLGSSLKNREAAASQRAHIEMNIHPSENVLYPTLVPFIDELLSGLQSSLARPTSPSSTTTSPVSEQVSRDNDDSSNLGSNSNSSIVPSNTALSIPNMPISIYLRLSRTQVKLSCEPTAQVSGLLDWADGRLLIMLTPGEGEQRQLTLSGRILDLSVRIQHAFSPEHCLSAATGAIVCSASMMTQATLKEQVRELVASLSANTRSSNSSNTISVILDMPGITSDLNIRHLQDWLAFERCWLTRRSTTTASSASASAVPMAMTKSTSKSSISASLAVDTTNTTSQPLSLSSSSSQLDTTLLNTTNMPWSVFIIFNLRSLSLNADLSQAIGIATAELTSVTLTSRTIPGDVSVASLHLGSAGLRSDGRIHSELAVKEIDIHLASLLQTLPIGASSSRVLSLQLDFGGLSAIVDYEYQRILLAELGTIKARASDRWQNVGRPDVQFELCCQIDIEHVEGIAATKTIPLLIRTADKITSLVQEKRTIVKSLFMDRDNNASNDTLTPVTSTATLDSGTSKLLTTKTTSATTVMTTAASVLDTTSPKLTLTINVVRSKQPFIPTI
ncbi:hypothetical protein BDF22DRAFT_227395 [Syncephalis plumigaleata]|nr:hypothetical protein BDF22DRAFT_227395 [Syncephalis plumigaleata]